MSDHAKPSTLFLYLTFSSLRTIATRSSRYCHKRTRRSRRLTRAPTTRVSREARSGIVETVLDGAGGTRFASGVGEPQRDAVEGAGADRFPDAAHVLGVGDA